MKNELNSNMNNTNETDRPVIVLVAFGTSMPEARKVFDHIDDQARKRFSAYEIRWGFTSGRIVKKLKGQGIAVKELAEVVDDLRTEGHRAAVFQSLHVVPGQEYEDINKLDTSGLDVAVGKALLSNDRDIETVIAAMDDNIDPAAVNVIISHGNANFPEFSRQLIALAEKIHARYDNVIVCSIEGQPGTGGLIEAKRQASQTGRVHFIPLMVVAGTHVMDDVLGDADDSWKNIIGAKESTCATPLGRNDRVLDVFFEHLETALASLMTTARQELGNRK